MGGGEVSEGLLSSVRGWRGSHGSPQNKRATSRSLIQHSIGSGHEQECLKNAEAINSQIVHHILAGD